MVLGQAQDIQAEKSEVNLNINDITLLQQNKTGALIEWSAISGAILSNHDDRKLLNYAKSFIEESFPLPMFISVCLVFSFIK